jgi:hypothetical protein
MRLSIRRVSQDGRRAATYARVPVAAAPAVIAPAMHCMHTLRGSMAAPTPGGQAFAGASDAGTPAAASRASK